MYDNYSFVLEWDDLSTELQDQKINEVIEHNYYHDSSQREIDGTPICLSTYLESNIERDKVAAYIATHFPLYF